MNKLNSILISTRTMTVLMVIYFIAMAVATFVENDYGTPTAKALIYQAKWFELVMLLLIANFIGNMFRYRLFRREKWPLLVFHLSFVLLFIGGAITRYISFEGTMNIREGASSNEIISEKQFFKIQIEQNGDRLGYKDIPYIMSPFHCDLKANYLYNGKKISVEAKKYLQRKKDSLVPNSNGKDYLHLVSTGENGRENIYLKSGDVKNLHGMLVSFNRPIEGAVEISQISNELYIKTPTTGQYMTMATQKTTEVKANETQKLALRSLYSIQDLKLVVPEALIKGNLLEIEGDKKKDANLADLLRVEVTGPKSKQIVDLSVAKSSPNLYKQITIDGLNLVFGFGPKIYTTPFSLKLDRFVMQTYPGSQSPSSYESHIKIIDEGKQTPFRIFMNHILDYKGYRFFQASFDPDLKGTQLSVNHDFWGTLITYIGYTLLFSAMLVSLFWKGTRFSWLNKTLKELHTKTLSLIFILFSLGLMAQHAPNPKIKELSADEVVKIIKIDTQHSDLFGHLLVQSYDGRIVPMNTQALEVLRKLYKKDEFNGLNANQWFLAVSLDPMLWTQVPIIKVGTKGGETIKKLTKANDKGYTSLVNLFPSDANGNLRFALEDDYTIAFRKKPSDQSNYDKEVIAVNDRVQVFNGIISGQYMRMIPVQNDPNYTWNSWQTKDFKPDQQAQKIMAPYFLSVQQATVNNQWSKASAELKKLEDYQQKWGKNVVPSRTKVNVEVLLNEANLFLKLLIFYTIIGFVLLIFAFIQLFRPSKLLETGIKVLLGIEVLGFVAHFLGLAGRWYVSGHAPWSNGYEAVMFISWVGVLAGFMLYRNRNAFIPAAGCFVAVIMMGFAHGGAELDPQITPLVPVLKSYWLIVHVAIITSSYGFFALSALISTIVLLYYIIANSRLFALHDVKIKELSIVGEMSLTIGLFLLTVGTFLGGIWANESWGRYWSWDPKETWAFISVIVYAVVLHMRLVPGLRGRYLFHLASIVSFSTVIMTYFGVNYYLSGLHSYAKGDPVPIPNWVYISLAIVVVLSSVSGFKYKILNKSLEK